MQTKDIPVGPYLEFLADRQDQWTIRYDLPFPADVPEKVRLSFVKMLIRRGLSGGCDCGCRADLCITDKGLALIGRERTHPYTGY